MSLETSREPINAAHMLDSLIAQAFPLHRYPEMRQFLKAQKEGLIPLNSSAEGLRIIAALADGLIRVMDEQGLALCDLSHANASELSTWELDVWNAMKSNVAYIQREREHPQYDRCNLQCL